MNEEKIVLSELIQNDNKTLINWAYNVVNKAQLSQEEIAISEAVNGFVAQVDKFGSQPACVQISQLINKIVEPEVFQEPAEVLTQIFAEASYEEFDKIKYKIAPKNTLIARKSAPRTGNVDRSWIDFSKGTVQETHFQIETDIRMSDMRRNGAYHVALITVFAIEEFNRKKFWTAINFVDSLLAQGGSNVVVSSGGVTAEAFDQLTGYAYDHSADTTPIVAGLSHNIRKALRSAGVKDVLNDAMKGELNKLTYLKEYNGCRLAPVKSGKLTGEGKTLLPEDRIFAFAGQIGEMYTKGSLRTATISDDNFETISFKFSGVEFGFLVTDLTKIAKMIIMA